MISYEERERIRARANSRWARLTGLTLVSDVRTLLDDVDYNAALNYLIELALNLNDPDKSLAAVRVLLERKLGHG